MKTFLYFPREAGYALTPSRITSPLGWRFLILSFDRQSFQLSWWTRVVTKISSCRVNTTSRRGIKRLGISFGSIFFYFPIKVAGENLRPPALNDNPVLNLLTLNPSFSWSTKVVESKRKYRNTGYFTSTKVNFVFLNHEDKRLSVLVFLRSFWPLLFRFFNFWQV